ncbi:MAG TPA: hypothetical protein VN238_04430 [Solirubrobacteraceae bacterium]|nr:hypothetical protein [Solirubrobacteraceae bacterium]
MTKSTTLLAIAALMAILAALPAAASAKTNIRVGIGDQQAGMFDQPAFQQLKIKRVRYFVRWDAMAHPNDLAAADRYVAAARKHGVSVFMHISSDNLTRKKAKLPKLATYKSRVTKLVKHFRAKGVKEWGARNEANHDSQATYKSPKRAADEFKIVRGACKGCTVVALDVLDQSGATSYVRRFYAALGSYKRYAKVVGIHNYSDVNRKRTRGTKAIINEVKKRDSVKTQFWLTETGGVVNFGSAFPYSTSRAASRLKYLFTSAKGSLRKDVKRIYVYNWTGAERGARFDAGLTNPDGSARPALAVFKQQLSGFLR